MAKKCKIKRQAPPQDNNTEESFVSTITEVNLVGGADGWWVDTSASRYVCNYLTMFKTYTDVKEKKVLLGDSHTTNATRIRNMELTFTFGKTILLKDILHTP